MTREGAFARDYGLSGQIQRAAVSVMSNIAEGFEREGRSEFHQFLTIAKASAGEARSLLYVALDAGYLDQAAFDQLFAAVAEASRVVSGLRTAVGRQRPKQPARPPL